MKVSVYIDRLEALSLREQVLIGATLVALVVSVLQFFLLDPLSVRQNDLISQVRALASTNERQQRRLNGEELSPVSIRQALLEAEITDLEQQVKTQEAEISQLTSTLVPATQMPALLQALLAKESVHLVSLVNVPPIPLLPEATETSTETSTEIVGAPGLQLFAHGIQLELRGDFHTLRRYLLAIEQQPWEFVWQAVRLESSSTGESVMQLQLQTLSTDSAWLGV